MFKIFKKKENDYREQIKDHGLFFLGRDENDFEIKISPSSLITIGEPGSGKSIFFSSLLYRYYSQNKDNSVFFIVNTQKIDSNDLRLLTSSNKENVFPIIGSVNKMIECINLLYTEMIQRQQENKDDVDNVFLLIESLNQIINLSLSWDKENQKEGSDAWKLKELIKHGSKVRIYVLGAIMSSVNEDFIKIFENVLIFKNSLLNSLQLIGSEKSYQISQEKNKIYFLFNGQEFFYNLKTDYSDWKEILK